MKRFRSGYCLWLQVSKFLEVLIIIRAFFFEMSGLNNILSVILVWNKRGRFVINLKVFWKNPSLNKNESEMKQFYFLHEWLWSCVKLLCLLIINW